MSARPESECAHRRKAPWRFRLVVSGQRNTGQSSSSDLNQARRETECAGFPHTGSGSPQSHAFWAACHKNVLGNGDGGNIVQLLMDDADACVPGLRRKLKMYFLPVQTHGARICLIDAGQHLDQRRFACAIFPEQGHDFTLMKDQIYVVSALTPGKDLLMPSA